MVSNSGTISVAGTLVLDATGGEVTFTGGGDIVLAGGTISGVTNPTETLHNDDNIISGTGQIGTGNTTACHCRCQHRHHRCRRVLKR